MAGPVSEVALAVSAAVSGDGGDRVTSVPSGEIAVAAVAPATAEAVAVAALEGEEETGGVWGCWKDGRSVVGVVVVVARDLICQSVRAKQPSTPSSSSVSWKAKEDGVREGDSVGEYAELGGGGEKSGRGKLDGEEKTEKEGEVGSIPSDMECEIRRGGGRGLSSLE